MRAVQKLMRTVPTYSFKNIMNQYPPCNIENCMCLVYLNVKDSYNDRYHYQRCYERQTKYIQKTTIKFDI